MSAWISAPNYFEALMQHGAGDISEPNQLQKLLRQNPTNFERLLSKT